MELPEEIKKKRDEGSKKGNITHYDSRFPENDYSWGFKNGFDAAWGLAIELIKKQSCGDASHNKETL